MKILKFKNYKNFRIKILIIKEDQFKFKQKINKNGKKFSIM